MAERHYLDQDCPFCIAESWYGEGHMSSCPQEVVKHLDAKLVRYYRFLKRLGRIVHISQEEAWQEIKDFLAREKSK